MNINLGAAAAKKKEKKFGLNKRGPAANVLGGDESSSEEEEQSAPKSSRAAVNRALEKEQSALRKRAQEALEGSSVYDFDGSYDDIHQKKESASKEPDEKKSRYIADLLKASKTRQQEREIIMERKIARDQNHEDQKADFRDKEKFVTSAYRQKLEERKAWLKEDELKTKQEQEDDVTKREGGMANFYGNFSRNVAVGGNAEGEAEADGKPAAGDSKAEGVLFLDGFAKASNSEASEEQSPSGNDAATPALRVAETAAVATDPSNQLTMREIREKKVAEARIRYFERHGISA